MEQVKIEIICRDCGKPFVHTKICRNRDAAESYEEWARENVTTCPACYAWQRRAAERAEQDAITEQARADVAGMEFSALQGSTAQIRWETDIRIRAAAKCKKCGGNDMFWSMFNALTSAKWWIDHRDSMELSVKTIAKLIVSSQSEEVQNHV